MVAREKMASFASDAPVPVQPGREQVSISVSGIGADALSAGGWAGPGLSLVLRAVPRPPRPGWWDAPRGHFPPFFKTTSVGQSLTLAAAQPLAGAVFHLDVGGFLAFQACSMNGWARRQWGTRACQIPARWCRAGRPPRRGGRLGQVGSGVGAWGSFSKQRPKHFVPPLGAAGPSDRGANCQQPASVLPVPLLVLNRFSDHPSNTITSTASPTATLPRWWCSTMSPLACTMELSTPEPGCPWCAPAGCRPAGGDGAALVFGAARLLRMASVLVARSSSGSCARAAHHAQQGRADKGQKGHHHRHRVAWQAEQHHTACAGIDIILIAAGACRLCAGGAGERFWRQCAPRPWAAGRMAMRQKATSPSFFIMARVWSAHHAHAAAGDDGVGLRGFPVKAASSRAGSSRTTPMSITSTPRRVSRPNTV